MSLKARFVEHLLSRYKGLNRPQLDGLISDQLLSPFKIKLPLKTVETIKSEIKSYWKLRQWGIDQLSPQLQMRTSRRPGNFGVCMSYDFHLNNEHQPELIEINTNAAFLALGVELYNCLEQAEPVSQFSAEKIIQMFNQDRASCGLSDPLNVLILDEKPTEQRLYSEFLVFEQMFLQAGGKAQIIDIPEVNLKWVETFQKNENTKPYIYNRYTDFFLETPVSTEIKKLYEAEAIELSPHPMEYFLLADKQRFLDWSALPDSLRPQSLLKTLDMGTSSKDEIWAQRKNLFFKPKNSYGSKQVYKGASISRKIFDEIASDQFIAQQISPAPERNFEYEGQLQSYKFDLRCYAYKDQLQMIIARIYQGQTTNLRTPGGGFALIEIE